MIHRGFIRTNQDNRNSMGVALHFNNRQGNGATGTSLFDCADALGIKVPTSCHKQGKC